MKNCFKILLTIPILLLSYASINAHSIYPLKQEITLNKGSRTTSEINFTNQDNTPVEVSIKTYSYNPKTDSIYENKEDIFLKTDTDTTLVQSNENKKIMYEIIPLSNTPEGTYFNVISLTPVSTTSNISLSQSISQLVVLHIVENTQNNITTEDYTVNIEIIDKGIPLLQPIKIKYTVTNNSNFVITPDGNIEVFNTKGKYKSYTTQINQKGTRLYPKETLEEELEIKGFNISDLFFNRTALTHIYNGLDNKPQEINIEINSYKVELLIALSILIATLLLIKSIKADNN